MKPLLTLILAGIITTSALAGSSNYYSKAIFSDDFSAGKFGPRWGHYKSSSVVKDGVLVGITGEKSDHPAVDSIRFPGERDLEVSVKFRFTSDKAKTFNVWFDDKDYKGSHAGHICNVVVAPAKVTLSDAKFGIFMNEIQEKRKATPPKPLTKEEKASLATKSKAFPVKISLQEWHTLLIQTKNDQINVSIDGKEVGSFKSEGVKHETKSLVSLTTNRIDVEYDDFSIKAAPKQ